MPELNLLKNTSTKVIKDKTKTYVNGEMTAEYDQKDDKDITKTHIDINFLTNQNLK